MIPEPDTRVDELRQQLRSLGYLDAGVDRFVLGAASDRRGPVGVAARTAGRVGLLGGALLGPAAALGLGARLPGLVSGPRDAIVLALYLAVFFFVAVAIASGVVSLAASAFARTDERFAPRARGASRAAAWAFTIGSLLYLTLWWRNANAGFGWSAPVWTAFALIVAVAISLLLGHAVRIATLAVLAAKGAGAAQLPPVPASSWRVAVSGGIVAFAGASALLLMTVKTDEAAAAGRPALTVVSRGQHVRLIAIDGFDRDSYVQLRASLPHLQFTLSWRNATLAPQDTSDPARAWTTIATGVPPDAHGVHALETRRVAGIGGVLRSSGTIGRVIGEATDAVRLTRPAVASREDRRAKTVWEVAEEAGLRTGVVNWWASWPAPPQGGITISDRAVLRLERGGALDAEIAPPDVYERLRAQWPDIRRQARGAAEAAFTGSDTHVRDILRRSAELDASIAAVALALPSADLDLFVVYLPGLDIAQNTLLGPTAGALAPSDAAARVEALRSYYPFLDRIAGPLLEPAEKQVVMLVTQPGRVQTGSGLFAVGPDYATSRLGGVAIFPDDERGTRRADPLDVAPTIWRALGVPLSRELPGKPVGDLLGDAPGMTDRFVDAYGRPFIAPAARTGKPLDQEMIDRLRSLGYVK